MGATFSDDAPPAFPTDGKAMTVKVSCSHNGQSFDVSTHHGCKITSEWTAESMWEMIEEVAGVHRGCQRLLFAGKTMERKCTLQSIMGLQVEQLPDRVSLFLMVDREQFPQKLGPFRPMQVPFEADDFDLPELTHELKNRGFYWEMKTGIIESYGLRAQSNRITGQMSPLHSIVQDAALRKVAGIPHDAQDFAWSYPVSNWERVEHDAYALNDWSDWDQFEGSAAMKSFLSMGGFVYLDAEGSIVGVSTFGQPAKGQPGGVQFEEPKKWRREWTLALVEQGRFQPITMRALQRVGACLFCWLRPEEIIESADGEPLPSQPEVPNGAFVYLFHDDALASSPSQLALDRYFPIVFKEQSACPPCPGMFRPFSFVEGDPNFDDSLCAPTPRIDEVNSARGTDGGYTLEECESEPTEIVS